MVFRPGLCAAALLALTCGCGGQSSPDEEVRAAATEYLRAFSHGDANAMCERLEHESAHHLIESMEKLGRKVGHDCRGAATAIIERSGERARSSAGESEVIRVDVDGVRATVDTRNEETGAYGAKVHLRKIRDEWKVVFD